MNLSSHRPRQHLSAAGSWAIAAWQGNQSAPRVQGILELVSTRRPVQRQNMLPRLRSVDIGSQIKTPPSPRPSRSPPSIPSPQPLDPFPPPWQTSGTGRSSTSCQTRTHSSTALPRRRQEVRHLRLGQDSCEREMLTLMQRLRARAPTGLRWETGPPPSSHG